MNLRRQHQTIFGDKKGNCFATCIACMLKIPVSDVPNFCADRPSRWLTDCNEWLAHRRWTLFDFGPSVMETHPGLTVIAAGPGPRGPSHSVIMRDGKLLHDPHPQGNGLLSVEHAMALAPLIPCAEY